MGNCAGCAGPQRTYRVQKLQENSPIKSRLSNGNKYYPPANSNVKEFSFSERDKIVQRGSFNQNDVFGGIFGLTQSKSRHNISTNELYNNGLNENQNNLLFQVMKTHIKLYPDNPQNPKQVGGRLEKSLVYQRDEDLRVTKNQNARRQSFGNGYSNTLFKPGQEESRRYLKQFNNQQRNQKSPIRMVQPSLNSNNQIKMSRTVPFASSSQNSPFQNNMPRFDDISQIRGDKMSRNYYDHDNSLPIKKHWKYNRGLTVIQEILQEDHKTPLDIKLQRKKNGEDVIYDNFQGFPEELEPLQIPNFSKYLNVLKEVVQKN